MVSEMEKAVKKSQRKTNKPPIDNNVVPRSPKKQALKATQTPLPGYVLDDQHGSVVCTQVGVPVDPTMELSKLVFEHNFEKAFNVALQSNDMSIVSWLCSMILEKLKVLDLSYCKDLIRSPYFLQVPHLEILVLEECTNLVKLHKSIGHLKELVLLNLKGCTNLRYLPSNISTLKSLEKLNLSGCLNLDKLLEKIPKNFLRARPLGRLVLNNCDLSEDQMPIDLGNLSSLQGLDLSGNNFRNLPACINRLQQLQHLDIGGCGSLQSISGLPSKIESLFAYGCCSIESLSFSSSSQLAVLCLDSCSKLVEIQGLVLDSNSTISLIGCDNLSSDFRESLLQVRSLPLPLLLSLSLSLSDVNNVCLKQCPPTMSAPCNREAFLPGNEIPNWFIHQRIGSSISLNLPSVSEGEIRMLLVCGIYACGGLNPSGPIFNVIMDNKTRGYREALLPGGLVFLPINYSEDIFLFRWQVSRNKMVVRGLTPKILEIGNGDEIAVSFELGVWTEVKKCGVHVVVDEPKVLDIHGSPHANSNTIAYDKVFKVDATGDEDS
ncbi:TMV resistance protein N [Morella rubra]|uniref:TMV resistance protein N n=1 Tax=Morella rubra TaxID=262757 RepID=A0A6A1X0P6_9ROSI|nr:TMV resistance protein N [Morella rubra]